MKIIEVDEELYQYIASKTQSIGESASDILRRLLNLSPLSTHHMEVSAFQQDKENKNTSVEEKQIVIEDTPKTMATSATATLKQDKKPIQSTQEDLSQNRQKTISQLTALLNSAEFVNQNKAVVRFLSILTLLYTSNPEVFSQATEQLQGRTRVYFAKDKGTLLQAGHHTKPKLIPSTPYWVITNTNSGRKMLMLEGVMSSMDLPQDIIEQVRSFFVIN